jgi:biotin carboxyl carrier protein
MKHTYDYRSRPFTLDLVSSGKFYTAAFNGKNVRVELLGVEGARLDLLIDGQPCSAFVSQDGAKHWVTVDGQTLLLVDSNLSRDTISHSLHVDGQLVARMSGLVRAVMVSEGQSVKKGQTLAVIEAMKMENKLTAPFDGQVKMIKLAIGQSVERDQVLIEME